MGEIKDLNLGGLWLFDPPEPACNTTRTLGIKNDIGINTQPPNISALPSALKFVASDGIVGNDPDYGGLQILKRRVYTEGEFFGSLGIPSLSPLKRVNATLFETEEQIEVHLSGLPDYVAPIWTVTYNPFISRGPYDIAGADYSGWWLIGGYNEWVLMPGGEERGGFAIIMYKFWNPIADSGDVFDSGISRLFDGDHCLDGLGPNRFNYVSPADGVEVPYQSIIVEPYYF